MRVGIATDHGGFGLKTILQAQGSMRLLISAFGLL